MAEACLSVVMPCFNEAATLDKIVKRVLESEWVAELVIVDDASTDGSLAQAEALAFDEPRIRVLTHHHNRGKGAALKTGFAASTSPFVIVQDADLEYDPAEYGDVIAPLLDGRADVVFGSRFLGGRPHRVLYFWHSVGNRVLTLVSNTMTNLNLTDVECCFKAFRSEVLRTIEIEEPRFGVEPELAAKVAAGGWRVYEVGVSYSGRTYAEGKKIGWRDGVHALGCIVKYGRRPKR